MKRPKKIFTKLVASLLIGYFLIGCASSNRTSSVSPARHSNNLMSKQQSAQIHKANNRSDLSHNSFKTALNDAEYPNDLCRKVVLSNSEIIYSAFTSDNLSGAPKTMLGTFLRSVPTKGRPNHFSSADRKKKTAMLNDFVGFMKGDRVKNIFHNYRAATFLIQTPDSEMYSLYTGYNFKKKKYKIRVQSGKTLFLITP